MVSFAFNTLIGQVTPIAMESVGWRYYILFVVCNFTNALWFWAFQPETKRRPLEEMNYLFTNAPYVLLLFLFRRDLWFWDLCVWLRAFLLTHCSRLFVPTMDMKDFAFDLEHRVMEIEEKQGMEKRVEG